MKPFVRGFGSTFLSGFCQNDSTQQALLRFVELFPGAVNMNLSKAFDSSNHDLLFAQCRSLLL